MLNRIFCSHTIFGLNYKQLLDEILAFWRATRWRLVDSPSYGCEHIINWFSFERVSSFYKIVKRYTYRPEVTLLTIFVIDHSWCHVIASSNKFCDLAFGLQGESKIYQLKLVGVTEHNVIKFNVSVNNLLALVMQDYFKKIIEPLNKLLLRESLVLSLDFLELFT